MFCVTGSRPRWHRFRQAEGLAALESGIPLLADRGQAFVGVRGLEVLRLLAGLELELVFERRVLAAAKGLLPKKQQF